MQNKVVIITGASSGIGKACATKFAENGAQVVLAARNIKTLHEIKTSINRNGGTAIAVKTDVRIKDECEKLIQAALKHFGKIDILINNAGISMRVNFEELKLEVIEELMNTNFMGTVYCTKYALPHIKKSKGTIVGVSSITGITPLPGRTGYCASKHAMQGFLDALRIETHNDHINIITINPGYTSSEIRKRALLHNGLPQLGTPRNEEALMPAEKVASKIMKTIMHHKRQNIMTIQGKAIVFIYKLFPHIGDKLILREMRKEVQTFETQTTQTAIA